MSTTETETSNQNENLVWETPALENLGQIEPVQGGAGLNVEGGLAGS